MKHSNMKHGSLRARKNVRDATKKERYCSRFMRCFHLNSLWSHMIQGITGMMTLCFYKIRSKKGWPFKCSCLLLDPPPTTTELLDPVLECSWSRCYVFTRWECFDKRFRFLCVIFKCIAFTKSPFYQTRKRTQLTTNLNARTNTLKPYWIFV